MKKTLLLICSISICAFSFSQMTSKNGHSILPEEGDWAIQMNAIPLINMGLNALDIMNDSGNNASHPGYVDGFEQVIVGKYFNNDNFATRYKIALTSAKETHKTFGNDPTTELWYNDNNGSGDELLYKSTQSYWELKVGYGHEYRRGHNRLQGFYGYEALLGMSRGSASNPNISWSYEFEYEDMFLAGWGDNWSPEDGASFNDFDRNGMGFSLEGRVFVGVEYFAAPKISIGAEFGWGFEMMLEGRGLEGETSVNVKDDGIDPINNDYSYNYTFHPLDEDEDPKTNYTDNAFDFSVDRGAGKDFGNMHASLTATFHF